MSDIDLTVEKIYHEIRQNELIDTGLMGGRGGVWLFNNWVFIDNQLNANLSEIIVDYLNLLQSSPHHTFSAGYAGLLKCLDFLPDVELDNQSEITITNYVLKYGTFELKKNNYDYLHGYLGVALGLLKLNPDFASHCVMQLQQSKIKSETITYWKSSGLKGEISGDLGLAHGSAGILAILTKFYNQNVEKETCYKLISEIISTFKICKRIGNDSLYGYVIDDKENSRLAWCYGDLGIARSIWLAGVACNREDWKQEGIDIMLHAAKRRDLQKNGVVDAGICHGTAGIAHIFNRFYRDTQLDTFKEATDYWIDQTLKMAKFKDGLAGYKSWQGPEDGWKNEYGLLEGIAGIGLVLHSYLHPEIEPTWDRCLLLS